MTFNKNNKKLNLKKYQKEIGFIFQNPETHFYYDTIIEEFKNVKNKNELAKVCSLFLKDIDLNRSPFLLSEGEKRRLSIVMTYLMDKFIFFFDEPNLNDATDFIFFCNTFCALVLKSTLNNKYGIVNKTARTT